MKKDRSVLSIMLFFLLIFLLPQTYAKEGHLTLLAVSEEGIGVTADVYLEIVPGTGRVFIDTLPFTKLDTQISTRLSRDVACDFLDMDCSDYDFMYTIISDAPIIGGPSAGAGMATLTVAVLEELEIDKSVAITGTINAGGFIGPVGSVKEKTEAASHAGIKKILIPKGTRYSEENSTNETVDLYTYGESLGSQVIEVSSLYDTVYHLTGKQYPLLTDEIVPPAWYTETMRQTALLLCNRTAELKAKITNTSTPEYLEALNFSKEAVRAFNATDYYATASFCFGANMNYDALFLLQENTSTEDILFMAEAVNTSITKAKQQLENQSIPTMTNLQTYLVVMERLMDAERTITLLVEEYEHQENLTNSSHEEYISSVYSLAYATERLYSTYAWSNFFNTHNDPIQLNKELLNDVCLRKISEVEQHYHYLTAITYLDFDQLYEQVDIAKQAYQKGDYVLCLYLTSKTKSDIDVTISSMSMKRESVPDAISARLTVAQSQILTQQQRGQFPILAYSYYEYAQSLIDRDPYSALIYSQYASELANLDVYIKEKEPEPLIVFDSQKAIIFVSGMLFGSCLIFLVERIILKRKNRKMQMKTQDQKKS